MSGMTYKDHAMMEFRAAGWTDGDGKFNDEMQESICNHVLTLLEVFGEEGHSGSSAPYAIDLFKTLAMFEPVVPLTGEDWEWNCVSDNRTDGVEVYQNKRCSHVFKQSDRFDGQAYDINSRVFYEWFVDENGERHKSYYTCGESHVPITFPYTPTREYVYKESEAQ